MALTSGLPVSRLVSVEVTLTQPGTQAPAINSCMLLGSCSDILNNDVINTTERIRRYDNITEVGKDFDPLTVEYQGAALWFSQSPRPDNLIIGRWAETATHGTIRGAPLNANQQLLSNWTTITNGGFKITVDGGTEVAITGLNFSGAGSLTDIAAIIDTAIDLASGPNVHVYWRPFYDLFQITSMTTGTSSSISFLSAPDTGTDVGLMMKLTSANQFGFGGFGGAYHSPGTVAEDPVSALIDIDDKYSGLFYGLVCPDADSAQDIDIAVYCEAADPPHYYGITSGNFGLLDPTINDDLASKLAERLFNKTAIQFSSGDAASIASMSYLARILTTEWRGLNTAMTLMYKQEPGVAPQKISSQDADTLAAKNCNVYVRYANGAEIIQHGVSCSGEFTDTIIGADALAGDVQNDLFNVMFTAITKVPQTDAGNSLLITAASARCQAYVNNGFLAPGVWNAQGFGTLDNGDMLSTGYYVFMPSVLTQPEADRAARKSTVMQIAAKCAGAIHQADVIIWVNQ